MRYAGISYSIIYMIYIEAPSTFTGDVMGQTHSAGMHLALGLLLSRGKLLLCAMCYQCTGPFLPLFLPHGLNQPPNPSQYIHCQGH